MAEAVAILLEDAEKVPLRKVLSKIKTDLEKGLQLSVALEAFPSQFSAVFISILRAGETSGNLESSLLQIAMQLKKENDLKKKIMSAMAYPAILLACIRRHSAHCHGSASARQQDIHAGACAAAAHYPHPAWHFRFRHGPLHCNARYHREHRCGCRACSQVRRRQTSR